jgi:hypothetical protein
VRAPTTSRKTSVEEKETLSALREGAHNDIKRAMLLLQIEIAHHESVSTMHGVEQDGDAKALRVIARRLRSAWNLVDCLRLEIGGLTAELEASAPTVTQ